MTTMIEEHTGAIWMDPLRGKYPPSIPDLEQAHKIKVPTCIFAGMEDKIFVPLAGRSTLRDTRRRPVSPTPCSLAAASPGPNGR